MEGTIVVQVLRLVDDFLITDNATGDFHQTAVNVLDIFKRYLTPLILSHEPPVKN